MYRQVDITSSVRVDRSVRIESESGGVRFDVVRIGDLGSDGVEEEIRIVSSGNDSSGAVKYIPIPYRIRPFDEHESGSLGVSAESCIDGLGGSIARVTSDFGDVGERGEEVGDVVFSTNIGITWLPVLFYAKCRRTDRINPTTCIKCSSCI